MLNRKSGLLGAPPYGCARAGNEGVFIRRVSAFADDGKQSATDEVASPDWGSPDTSLRCGGGATAISWSAESLHFVQRDAYGASFSQLDSPKSSYVGSPTRCTGGGHGEAGPTSSGGMRLSFGSDPTSFSQPLASPTRKSTTLARHLAERTLLTRNTRRSIDCPAQLRPRDSMPSQASAATAQLTAPVNAISSVNSTPTSHTTFEKLPSFLRTSTPSLSLVPEPPSSCAPQRLPDSSTPHSSLYASSPSNGSVLIPWMASNKDFPSNTSGPRALTPVTGATPARPNRVLLASRQPRTPLSLPSNSIPSNSEGYLELSLGLRARLNSGGSFTTPTPPPVPARRPSSPPPFTPRQVPSCGLIHLWAGAPAAMRRGEWSMTQYTIARQLYGGYASSVFKARCLRSGTDVVLKVYTVSSLSDFLRNQVLRELDIHSRLEHQGVVQLLAAFREGDKLVLVLEYVRGGSLDRARRKLGGRLSEAQALELVMVPLLRTLHYLHTRAIMHRDIKPENILFSTDWKLKMCDYGVSVCLTEERAVTRTGSRDYMAPEVQVCPLKRSPDDNKTNAQLSYTAAADIWSLGVLTYELLVGFTPFPGGPPPPPPQGSSSSEGGSGSLSGGGPSRSLAFPSCISADARAFVLSCLADMPGDRPSIYELLKHRWVQGALAA